MTKAFPFTHGPATIGAVPFTTPRSLMPRPASPKPRPLAGSRHTHRRYPATATIAVLALAFFSLPSILALDIRAQNAAPAKPSFPVSVDPRTKTITESPAVEGLSDPERIHPAGGPSRMRALSSPGWPLPSPPLPWYQQLAGADTVFVTIYPGYRKEEVAAAFGSKLDWNSKERQQFLKDVAMPSGGGRGAIRARYVRRLRAGYSRGCASHGIRPVQ